MQNNIEIAAVVVALTELVKSWGVPSKLCPTIAVLFGIGLTLGDKIMEGGYTTEQVYASALQGVVIGITSTGLYRVGKNITKKKEVEVFDGETY